MSRKSPGKKGKKTFAWQPKNEFLYNLMASRIGVMAINWVFQGMLGMDLSELLFRFSYELVITLFATVLLYPMLPFSFSIAIGIFIGHTLNWLFNSHFWVAGRFSGITRTSPERIKKYIQEMERRLTGKDFIIGAAIWGSLARDEVLRPTSDVDIRLVRAPGIKNAFPANFYATFEKARAFMTKFPLDLYLHDHTSSLDVLSKEEKPIILYDPKGIFRQKYSPRGYRTFDAWLKSDRAARNNIL